MIVYVEKSPKNLLKLLELINECSKFARYESTHKINVFLYTSNAYMEIKVIKIIPFTIA